MKKATVGGLLLSLALAQAKAQSQPDTVRIASVGAAIDGALLHNPTQAVYQQQLRQAQYNYKAAKGLRLPQASAGFTGTDNLKLPVTPVPGELVGRPGTTYYAQFGRQYAYTAGLTLSQKLFDWPTVLQAKVAQGNVELNRAQQAAYAQTLKEQVAQLYFSALIAKAALQINQLDARLADTVQTLARQRLQAGTADLLSANQAAINASNVRQNQAQSQQLFDQSLENLKVLLGEKPTRELCLTETLPPGAVPAGAGPALQPDKTLAPYETQLGLAATQSRLQRAAAYPAIAASAFLGNQQFRDDFGLSFGANAWRPYQYIGLSINVPLFTGFANYNKNRSTEAQATIAQLQLDQARDQSVSRDRLLLKNQAAYRDMVSSSATSFRLYGDNLRLSQQKYREGVLPLDGYLRAFQDYLMAENLYLNNLSLFLANYASLLARQ
ncbi:TolC family protein [Hymenobacter canadensis]|uniref:TolC family protein n=1 Tax=Hymenobacter canadensis TaxID=2999067 RepID=A0ABY7LUQ9_9BACT|nr:TolC family protein [Hymenobacter canadensis]WBA44128.1 TolC family protein [Hymenobacter canadensis]